MIQRKGSRVQRSVNSLFSFSADSSQSTSPEVGGNPLGNNYENTGQKSIGLTRLGHTPNLANFIPEFDLATGEVLLHDPEQSARRLARWAMMAGVRDVLDGHRSSWCLRRILPQENDVIVNHYPNIQRSSFSNLMVCGNAWACPICSRKIAIHRRAEMKRAMNKWHVEMQKPFMMITLTFRHKYGDDLKEMMEWFSAARTWLYQHRDIKDLLTSIGYEGRVRSLECTFGDNGWHPHTHEVLFIDSGFLNALQLRTIKAIFVRTYKKAAKEYGLDFNYKHGVDIKFIPTKEMLETLKNRKTITSYEVWDEVLMRYVTKYEEDWETYTETVERDLTAGELSSAVDGLSKEITFAAMKKARGKRGASPFQLLYDYVYFNDAYSGAMFAEFVTVFSGGRRRALIWSDNLRKKLGLNEVEKSDEELAKAHADVERVELGRISRSDWYKILRKGSILQGEILEIANSGDWSAVEYFLEKKL